MNGRRSYILQEISYTSCHVSDIGTKNQLANSSGTIILHASCLVPCYNVIFSGSRASLKGRDMAPSLSFHLLSSSTRSKHLIPVLVSELDGTFILRTLDPEYPHQVSFARILHAANIPLVTGLVRFKLLEGLDYCTTLGVSGPNLTEIWISVSKARSLIAQIWSKPPVSLIELTSPALDPCWSLFDRTRSSLLHNWRISTISPVAYSTALLLEAIFAVDQVKHETDKSDWTRTGIPSINETGDDQDPLDVALITWSISASERFLTHTEESQILDEWSQVISAVNDLLDPEDLLEEEHREPIDRPPSDQFEITVVASYEKILRKLRGKFLLPERQRKKGFRNISVQTDTYDPFEDTPTDDLEHGRTTETGTQTETLQVSERSSINLWILLPTILVGLTYLNWHWLT